MLQPRRENDMARLLTSLWAQLAAFQRAYCINTAVHGTEREFLMSTLVVGGNAQTPLAKRTEQLLAVCPI